MEFVNQHNMVACLVKTDVNVDFHQIVDFLSSSYIHHSLTVSPIIYASYIEQFWNAASSTTVNDEKQIHATVDSKAVVVTEASIRSSLLFNDADGTPCLTNEEIFQNLKLMGYEGDFNKLTFQKALFSPQWKYLIHTILHCLSSKSTSWNEFSINIASAVICLATNAKFNFSKLIFDGMLRNLDNTKKKFLMYPRFLTVFLNDQIELGEPFNDVYPTPAHTQKVFSNMARKSAKFSGKITPLFDNMLVPHQASEGEGSEQPTESQPTPSPAHPSTEDQPSVPESSSTHDTTQDSRDSLEGTHGHDGDQVQTPHDSPLSGGQTSDRAEGALNLQELFVLCTNLSNKVLILETAKEAQAAEILRLKERIKKLKQKSKPVISYHRAYMRSVQRLSIKKRFGKKESVSKQGRKKAKPESTLDDSTTFDDLDIDHGMDYMETEEDVGERKESDETKKVNLTADTEKVIEDKGSGEKGESTEELVSTAVLETVSAARPNVVEPEILPTISSIFDDEDITMAQTLIKLKEEKAKEVKAKEKGVTIKDTEDFDRPRTTTERSVLTLKPLPKIDPKDKGKKVLEEEAASDAESEGVNEAERKFAQLERDAEIARKLNEDMQAKLERERIEQEEATKAALIRDYDDIQARIETDRILAARLQEEERESFTVEQRAKFLHDTIAAQRRFLAQQRSEAIRNRPPTKNQLRNQMMTYLKHVGNFKHVDLNRKKFEEIQTLYERQKKFDQSFVPIGSVDDEKMIEKMNKKAAGIDEEQVIKEPDSTKEESKEEEGTRKRKLSTRKKMKSKKEAPDEDKEVDYEILDKKYPIIEWKSVCLGTKPQFDETKDLKEINLNMVVKSNGQKRFFSTLMKELSMFDREDLNAVYQLVMDRYQNEVPEGIVIHMLVEKKYPLKKNVLLQMPELKLESEEDITMALELIRFVKKLIVELEPDGDEKDV
ncbi:hypothetical protein Tco_0251934 [Tanacetum coccineum]